MPLSTASQDNGARAAVLAPQGAAGSGRRKRLGVCLACVASGASACVALREPFVNIELLLTKCACSMLGTLVPRSGVNARVILPSECIWEISDASRCPKVFILVVAKVRISAEADHPFRSKPITVCTERVGSIQDSGRSLGEVGASCAGATRTDVAEVAGVRSCVAVSTGRVSCW